MLPSLSGFPENTTLLHYIRENYLGRPLSATASPTGNWMQATLEAIDAGTVTLALEIRREMTNPYGGIHGGMMATFCDEAIGWSIITLGLERHYTSVNLNTDFLYTAMAGETIWAHGRVVRQGKKILNVEVHVYNEAQQLLAHTTSNLVVTNMPHTHLPVITGGGSAVDVLF